MIEKGMNERLTGDARHGGRKVRSVFSLLVCPALTRGSQAPARTRHKPAGPRKGTEFDHEKRYPHSSCGLLTI